MPPATGLRKSLNLFFTPSDEAAFSSLLRQRHPNTVFIGGPRWPTETPPAKDSIATCQNTIVMIWPRDIVPSLPHRRDAHGRIEGPMVGPVLQFLRSRPQDDTLHNGRIAASTTPDLPYDTPMRNFITEVWKALETFCQRVDGIDPATGQVTAPRAPMFRAGPDACAWHAAAPARRLQSGIAQFRPSPLATKPAHPPTA